MGSKPPCGIVHWLIRWRGGARAGKGTGGRGQGGAAAGSEGASGGRGGGQVGRGGGHQHCSLCMYARREQEALALEALALEALV